MNKIPQTGHLNSFRTVIVLVLLCILGLLVIPFLDLRLNPTPRSQILSIDYQYPQASPELIESEVTSLLEGAFATLSHLEEIQSNSNNGYGQIELKFNKYADLAKMRLEIAIIIRQFLPKLPKELSYPQISFKSNFSEYPTILVYNLLSKTPSVELQKLIDRQLVPSISTVEGVREVSVYGLAPLEWHVQVDEIKAANLGVSIGDVQGVIQGALWKSELGLGRSAISFFKGERISTQFMVSGPTTSTRDFLSQLIIHEQDGHPVYLSDFASFVQRPRKQQSIYRINGKETLTLRIYADKGINQLQLASRLKKEVMEIDSAMDDILEFDLVFDQSEFLLRELKTIIQRILVALLLLLGFIFLIRPDWKYITLITLSLVAVLLLANIGYYLIGLSLHLYSIAGWTLSIGIILDNSIVMASHLEQKGNRGIFTAILAATLTTIGALSMSFFNTEQFQEALGDFAWVFIINLLASLVITMFFVPALYDLLKMQRRQYQRSLRRLRYIVRFNTVYAAFIRFTVKYRFLYITLVLWIFGFPFFLLPDEVEETPEQWTQIYNRVIGSDFYQSDIKPILDPWAGGIFYRFYEVRDRFFFSPTKREETQLIIEAKMPFGGTVEQLDGILKLFETRLFNQKGLKRVETSIAGADQGRIIITFSEEGVKAEDQFLVKANMEQFAVETGGADFRVYGVGQYFNNQLQGDRFSVHLQLLGFNYEELWEIANSIKSQLLEHVRIQEVFINSERRAFASEDQYYRAQISQHADFNQLGINLAGFYQILQGEQFDKNIVGVRPDGNIRLFGGKQKDVWNLNAQPEITTFDKDSSLLKYGALTDWSIEKGDLNIVRINQQYQLFIEYKFLGASTLSNWVMEQQLKVIQPELPLGYQINPVDSYHRTGKSGNKFAIIIGISVLAIFLICGILFNSIWQAWVPVVTILPGFIGIFLSTIYVDFSFDQGGFASFLLVAGLSVNAALFIINDYNNAFKQNPFQSNLRLYLKAYNTKILPIIYTGLSSILGLLPFVLLDRGLDFWYALSLCTIWGILFSTLGILFFLPIIFLRSISKSKQA